MTDVIAPPEAGLAWNETWTDRLPAFRGLRVPPPPATRWPTCVTLHGTLECGRWNEFKVDQATTMLARIAAAAGTGWVPWWTLPDERITPEALQQSDAACWLELLAQLRSATRGDAFEWAVDACVQLHGIAFALDRVLALWVAESTARGGNVHTGGAEVLRAWIAGASEADHAAALAAAESQRPRDPVRRLACAWMFPHRDDWASAVLAEGVAQPFDVAECALPLHEFERIAGGLGHTTPALLLQVRLHGVAAFELLARKLAREVAEGYTVDDTLQLLAAFRVPALVPLLRRHADHAAVRAVLERVDGPQPVPTLPPGTDPAVVAAHALLADPPWRRGLKAAKLPVLDVAPQDTPEAIHWAPGEREQLLAAPPQPWRPRPMDHDGFPAELGLTEVGRARLLAGEPLRAGDANPPEPPSVAFIALAPESTRLALWNTYPLPWLGHGPAVRWLRAQYGTAALPGVIEYIRQTAGTGGLHHIDDIDSPRIVPFALHALRHQKKERERGARWLRRHARTALCQALPLAFQRAAGKARDDARHAIRWLAREGERERVLEVAAAYGPAMQQAAQALLDEDPMRAYPARMPELPAFIVVHRLARPALRGGVDLPIGGLEEAVRMLAISTADAPYAGLDLLKAACTPQSLSDFAWSVFEQWLRAGGTAADNWAFWALALLGDDECVRKLAPLVLKWPSEGASARAAQAVDLLAAIGTDVALSHLDAIANKAKTPALRNKAREKIEAIAQARELTREQLADRLVPRLGLDVPGADVLDFGPRRFTLHFDEALTPFAKDANGKRLKDLPKPAASDDAALAEAATRRWKAVKKDAKLIATQQVARFEHAMTERRRWSGAEFHALLLGHPVLRFLVARLAWAVFEDDVVRTAFRVAEDWTLADDHDAAFRLADDATVGVPHPVELGPERLRRLQALFDDYEVIQPFRQLARETYTLTDAERAAPTITRWSDRVLVCASVLGLAKKGWQATGGDSGGWISELARPCGDWRVEFRMEPGTQIGNPTLEPKQRVPQVALRAMRGDVKQDPTFGDLHPVHASELLRDFELLPQATA